MKSIKARKQRKAHFNAPLHKKQMNISSHLEENLLLKYDRRSFPLITGDTVKVTRGAFKGHEEKVARLHVKNFRVEVEGVTTTKADGKKIAKPIHPSNLLITKLNLTDKWRRRKLESKVSAETKKEIEAEAKQQLKEVEMEKKRLEAERLAAEKEAEKVQEEEVLSEDIKDESSMTPAPKKEKDAKSSEEKEEQSKKEEPPAEQREKDSTSSIEKTKKPSKAVEKKEKSPVQKEKKQISSKKTNSEKSDKNRPEGKEDVS